MGYTTEFLGYFKISPPITDENILQRLKILNETRRMKRDSNKIAQKLNISLEECIAKYGIDGEFYGTRTDTFSFISNRDETVIDYNMPPITQPGLWCKWQYNIYENIVEWDGNEKFYDYVEWLEYLIEKVFEPNGYKLNGLVKWIGECDDDCGKIKVNNNFISVKGDRYSDYVCKLVINDESQKLIMPQKIKINPDEIYVL
jgi:hypothetical protein